MKCCAGGTSGRVQGVTKRAGRGLRTHRVPEWLRRLDDAVQVRVHKLHHDVELVVVRVDAQVLERDDVGVLSQVPHQAHLPQGVLSINGGCAHGRDLLDRDLAPRVPIFRCTDHAVGACMTPSRRCWQELQPIQTMTGAPLPSALMGTYFLSILNLVPYTWSEKCERVGDRRSHG